MSRAGFAWALYRAASRAAPAALRVAALASPKLQRGLAGRAGLRGRLRAAAPGLQGCLWFHAASVGEYEQARPVLRVLRADGEGPLAMTHFSPSGREYASRHPEADFHDYLPLDRPADVAELVALWRPRALVFVKYDCWPNLVRAADEAGVPVLLLAGALPPGSRRRGALVRPLLRDVFDRFARIGVGSAADRRRFEALGVRAPVVVSGDTRAEQVLARCTAATGDVLPRRLAAWGGRRLILGSTWPPDEALWWPVLPGLLRDDPELRIVLAPHEPTEARVAALLAAAAGRGIRARRLAELGDATPPADARLLVIDRVGVLASLYLAGTLAYVGGSFTTGVHSTLEPAAAGLPVCFGPRIDNAEEALEMVDRGAGRVLRRPEDAAACARELFADATARGKAGAAARAVVEARVGAAARSAALVREVLAESSGARQPE